MIVLFTDFGLAGPYTGQVKAVLAGLAPGVPVIDLMADAPACDPRRAAYLLAAYAPEFPAGSVFVCVVDPGVGGERRPLVVDADGRRYVGPDNGLFELVRRRAGDVRVRRIDWRPARLSASFHGRDLFAPVAARLALGQTVAGAPLAPAAIARPDWPDDLAEIVYVDVYGNAMTGLRAAALPPQAVLEAGGRAVRRGRTFADVGPGEALWYENSSGLAEIAVNRGRADRDLGLAVGSAVTVAAQAGLPGSGHTSAGPGAPA
ncbi:SAM hydrolase/SAM-dependent halogenase family protein [Azospirillum sp. ST 5-10]|uniref:SAM hydrolase/SAM-dependent halogenase family protein n=1 Tax=unclassified Azospirillum TaxID=2630922 RepID=UPI003F4A154C